jgi:hypothetical protein
MFRMDPPTFAYLVVALSPRIDRNFVQAERVGGYISPELRVAMTIRWFAGGSYLDRKVHMGVMGEELEMKRPQLAKDNNNKLQ